MFFQATSSEPGLTEGRCYRVIDGVFLDDDGCASAADGDINAGSGRLIPDAGAYKIMGERGELWNRNISGAWRKMIGTAPNLLIYYTTQEKEHMEAEGNDNTMTAHEAMVEALKEQQPFVEMHRIGEAMATTEAPTESEALEVARALVEKLEQPEVVVRRKRVDCYGNNVWAYNLGEVRPLRSDLGYTSHIWFLCDRETHSSGFKFGSRETMLDESNGWWFKDPGKDAGPPFSLKNRRVKFIDVTDD